jgi:hypothetical protein
MNNKPTFNDLVLECSELLKTSLSEEGGYNDFTFLQNARFQSTLMFLKTDPDRILEIAQQDKQAAETVLKACATFIGSAAVMSEEAKLAIAKLMLRYEDYKKAAGSKSRFKQHPINILVIFMLRGLTQKYGIAPTRGDETSTQFAGCDIAAQACLNNGLERPTTYEGVKTVWMNRRKYFPGHASDEEMFDAILLDLPTYIQRLALADTQ